MTVRGLYVFKETTIDTRVFNCE